MHLVHSMTPEIHECSDLPEYACRSVIDGCVWFEFDDSCRDTMAYKVIDF